MADTLPPGTITRDNWGAVPPRVIDFGINHPVGHIYLTYTGTPPCTTTEECKKTVKDLQTQHMSVPLPDIRHSFLVGGDGNCYVGRGWVSDPDVPEVHKDKVGSIFSVAFIGQRGGTPSDADKAALSALVTKAISLEFIVPNPTYHEDY